MKQFLNQLLHIKKKHFKTVQVLMLHVVKHRVPALKSGTQTSRIPN